MLGNAIVVLLELTSELSPTAIKDAKTKVIMPAMSCQCLRRVHKSLSSKRLS
jgi:hypothetical protein